MILEIQLKSKYYEKGTGNKKELLDAKNLAAKIKGFL